MEFSTVVKENIESLLGNEKLKKLSTNWVIETAKENYPYNFSWFGRPAIQYPQDMIAMQEIIWSQKPDLILDIGVAHGGSVIYFASLMALLDMSEYEQDNKELIQFKPNRMVVGVDIDIRKHNRDAIEMHPMKKWINLIEGSSVHQETVKKVHEITKNYNNILICLDSNHTHEHVLKELNLYSPLIEIGGYCCVFDTIIEDMPKQMFNGRPWGPGNNPKTAVWEFLEKNKQFEIDKNIEAKIQATVAPDGYLKRVR